MDFKRGVLLMGGINPAPRVEELTFEADGLALRATLHRPEAPRPPVVIGCHGLLSDRHSPKQIALARACSDQGMAFLRLDHRGCGESAGRLEAVTTLAARAEDVHAAIRLITSRPDLDRDRIGLFGSSMGGAVCIAVAGMAATAALVTFAAPVRSRPLIEPPLPPGADAEHSRMRSILKEEFDLTGHLPRIGRILVVHGAADRIVPPAHAQEIYERAREPKRLILQAGGDHRMSAVIHQREFLAEAAGWFQRLMAP